MATGSWEADRGPSWVEDVGWVVRGYRQVVAVLDDPAFLVPAVEPDGRGVGWLRGSVSRFANGAEHARRRSQVEGLLGALEPAALRDKAATEARRVLERTAGGVVEVMSALARRVPLLVLARALAVEADTESLVEAIPVVAAAYPPGSTSEREEQADRAVEQLLVELGGRDESTASILAILVQACEANAGLIGNTLDVALRLPPPLPYVDLLLAETLRYRPPVRGTRRVASGERRIGEATLDAGSTVVLDLEAANRDPEMFVDPHRFRPGRERNHLTFGHGFRACPGSAQALALAAGVVEAVLARCEAASPEAVDERSPTLRLPAALEVRVR